MKGEIVFYTIVSSMKNFYEILEVNENASLEVIEKAYRVLAKKYHPDAWPPDKVYWAEDRFKEITEAYQTLSNDFLRHEYDLKIGVNTSFEDKYNELYRENENLKQEVNSMKFKNKSNEYINKIENNSNRPQGYFKKYFFAFKSLLQSEVNKSSDERAKDFKALILTIIIIAILIFVAWQVPFLHDFIFP